MSKVYGPRECPICGSQGMYLLNTRTNEESFACGASAEDGAPDPNACGYSARSEMEGSEESGWYWVETTQYPMGADGKVLRTVEDVQAARAAGSFRPAGTGGAMREAEPEPWEEIRN